jgi:hypothetical protein
VSKRHDFRLEEGFSGCTDQHQTSLVVHSMFLVARIVLYWKKVLTVELSFFGKPFDACITSRIAEV